MDIPESQNLRDARIETLWKKLDPQGKGEIDFNGLQRGLKKIDHPLKNAHDMLKDIAKAIDKNGDQVIQYEEFRTFVEQTEKELLTLFQSIDRDHNGKIDKNDLQIAFKKAGMTVPSAKLGQFFKEIDLNSDGYISFDEWRNFLLFLHTSPETPALKAVLSYYSSAIAVNAEGDTVIREDTLEGLGRPPKFLYTLFGVLFTIAPPPRQKPLMMASPAVQYVPSSDMGEAPTIAIAELYKPSTVEYFVMKILDPIIPVPREPRRNKPKYTPEEEALREKRPLLIKILPDPGYFVAGAIAGVISRTSTAPLDRLKVYLIANVDSASDSIELAKKGNAVQAARKLGQPLVNACRELWKAGGMRSLFAGNGLNVVKVMPESAIKFGSFEAAKRAMAQLEGHNDPNNINGVSKFMAGGVGGMVSQLCIYPLDTLKFRMQCETVSGGLQGNALIKATWKKMMAEGGFRGSYRGLTMGLVGMFPYAAIDLSTYEFLKGAIARRNARILGCHEADAQPGPFVAGLVGAFSGALGATVVYPLNLLRTRLQAQGTVLHPPTYTGIWDVTQKTVSKEGVRGLFKGITPNLLKVVPAVSITYVVYESSKKAMGIS